jgi:hypothetical protein
MFKFGGISSRLFWGRDQASALLSVAPVMSLLLRWLPPPSSLVSITAVRLRKIIQYSVQISFCLAFGGTTKNEI